MDWEIKKKQKQENDKCLREGNRFPQNFNLYLLRVVDCMHTKCDSQNCI